MSRVQIGVGVVAYFAAPFIGAAVAARFSRSLPLANGMTVALIGGGLAAGLSQPFVSWFPLYILVAALGAGAVGAIIGRALRPSKIDI